MQKIIALALVASSLVAFPVATPSFAVESGIQAHCGPDAPESYKRPGGYCDQVGSNNSLVQPDDKECIYLETRFNLNAPARLQLAAVYCYEPDYIPYTPV